MVPVGGFRSKNVREGEKVLWKRLPASNSLSGVLLPFTVTKPVTNREMSIAVESRDANRVF